MRILYLQHPEIHTGNNADYRATPSKCRSKSAREEQPCDSFTCILNQENLLAGRSKASCSIWCCKTGATSSCIPLSDTIPGEIKKRININSDRLCREASRILLKTHYLNRVCTFKELAEVKFALVHQMWHYFLVKTYDLKNQSLQQDSLGCLGTCSTWNRQRDQQPSLVIVSFTEPMRLNNIEKFCMLVPGVSLLSFICPTGPSAFVFFSSPLIFSFLLSDCHFAIMLVMSGKIWMRAWEVPPWVVHQYIRAGREY